MAEKYYYAVTRVHSQELGLLTAGDLASLSQAKDLAECFDILRRLEWGNAELPPLDVHALLHYETEKTWHIMEELVEELQPFEVFRLSHDYNNLKAAIKLAYANLSSTLKDTERYFMPFGTVDTDRMVQAAEERDFRQLPPVMAEAAVRASDALAHTGSGQYCDIIIDKVALESIYQAGMLSKNTLIEEYGTRTADIANISIALRGNQMKKPEAFFDLALADAGSLSLVELTQAALKEGQQDLHRYLRTTAFRDGVEELEKNSMASFERWCDNLLMDKIRPYRAAIGGMEPLAAFILARETEIKMVRLVLSGKINALDETKIQERMRNLYV